MAMQFAPSTDPKEIERQLSRSFWLVAHRHVLVQVAMGVLGVVTLAVLLFATFVLVDWSLGGGRAEQKAVARLAGTFTNFGAFHEHALPRDLVLEGGRVFSAGESGYDVVVPVTNPNTRWWAEVEYVIPVADGAAEMLSTIYILPGETKYLYRLGIPGVGRSAAASATIRTIKWFSLNTKIVQPDYTQWSAQRLGFSFADVAYSAGAAEGAAAQSARATFSVTNDTAFGYKDVGFYVVLMGGGGMVGFNHVTAADLRAGETRDLAATWYAPIGGVTRVLVQPETNIFDPANALAPGR
jgi:hypothetical protein